MEDSQYNDLLGRIESLAKTCTGLAKSDENLESYGDGLQERLAALEQRVTRYGERMYDIPGLVERIEALDSWLTKLDGDVKTRLGTLEEKLEQSQSTTGRDPVVALEDRTLRRIEELDTRMQMYFGLLQTQQFLLEQYRQLNSQMRGDIASIAGDVRALRRRME